MIKQDFRDPNYRDILKILGLSNEEIEDLIEDIWTLGLVTIELYGARITLFKNGLVSIPVYSPDEWNQFPDIQPPTEGEYLVTTREGKKKVTTLYWIGDCWSRYHNDVVAFRALPEPYKPEEPLDMHPDAIAARRYMGEEE